MSRRYILLKPRVFKPVFVVGIRYEHRCQDFEIALRIPCLDKNILTQKAICTQTIPDRDLLRIKRLNKDRFWVLAVPNPLLITIDIAIQPKMLLIGKNNITTV